MTEGQAEGASQVKADFPRTEQRIEDLERQLALTRQELDQWRNISGSHVVQRLLDHLAQRDREVVRLRSELEIAVGGPVNSGVPPAVLLEWSQSGASDDAVSKQQASPLATLHMRLPSESGASELPGASEKIGEPSDIHNQSSECTGSPASSERTCCPFGTPTQEWSTRGTVISGTNAGVGNRSTQARRGSASTTVGAGQQDDVELRREGLEQWIQGPTTEPVRESSPVPAAPLRAPPVPQGWGGAWDEGRPTQSTGDAAMLTSPRLNSPRSDGTLVLTRRAPVDAGGADDGAGAVSDGTKGEFRRTITPRGLAQRRGAVEQLQEEIHGEIAKHREAFQFNGAVEKPSAEAQPEVAGADVEPEEMPMPSQSGLMCTGSVPSIVQHGAFSQASARSVNSSEMNLSPRTMSEGTVRAAAYATMPMPSSTHCSPRGNAQVLVSTVSETSTALPADNCFEAATEASSEMASTAISGDRRSPRGSPKGEGTFDDSELVRCAYEEARANMQGRSLESTGDGENNVQRQPTGGSLVSCSFFVNADDDDGRKELRRRRFERNQVERRSRAAQRAGSNSSIADQKRSPAAGERQIDADQSGRSGSMNLPVSRSSASSLPLAHMPRTAPEEERPSPTRAAASSSSRGAHSRLVADRSRSPGQAPRESPTAESSHRFGPPMRVAAANAAAYAAAAAASALATVSAVKQEQRTVPQRQRAGVLSGTMPSAASGGSPSHATAARNRSSPRASPRPSPRPRVSPQNSPRVEERPRRLEQQQNRPQSETPASRASSSAGGAAGSMAQPTNVTTLRTKFTELRDEMKRRRSKETAEGASEQEPEESSSKPQRSTMTVPVSADPVPETAVAEMNTTVSSSGSATQLSLGSVDRGRPVTAGATSERSAQSPATAQEQSRKHALQQVPEQSRAQPILSRPVGGGNNSRSPRPSGGGSAGSGMNTRGRTRAHLREDGTGGGSGSFTGPTSASANANANAVSTAQGGLTRTSSARRRIGAGGPSSGRRAVPPISGLLQLRQPAQTGSGSHTVPQAGSGDAERPTAQAAATAPSASATPAPPVAPPPSVATSTAGSLRVPLPSAVPVAAANGQSTGAETLASEKATEQKDESFESVASPGAAGVLPSSNSAATLPAAPASSTIGTAYGVGPAGAVVSGASAVSVAASGSGSAAALSSVGGGSLQVGIGGAAVLQSSARHRRHSPGIGAQVQKTSMLVGTSVPSAVATYPTVVATPVTSPAGSSTGAANTTQGSPAGNGSSPGARMVPLSPRTDVDSETDPVHEAVLQFIQHIPNIRQPLVRVAPGVYMHGQKTLQLSVKSGRLMVRMGAGLIGLSETLLNSPALGGSGSSGYSMPSASSTGGSTVVQATGITPTSALSAASGFLTPGGTATISTPMTSSVVTATGTASTVVTATGPGRQTSAYHAVPVRVIPGGLRTVH